MTDETENRENNQDSVSAEELMPKTVYTAEAFLSPIFLVRIVGIVLSILHKNHSEELARKHEDINDIWSVGYLLVCFASPILGSLVYRTRRRHTIVSQLDGYNRKSFEKWKSQLHDSHTNKILAGWIGFSILSTVLFLILPAKIVAESLLTLVLSIGFFGGVVVGPLLVWHDVHRLRKSPYVTWGKGWVFLALLAFIPVLGILPHAVQRQEHIGYGAIAELLNNRPEIDHMEQSKWEQKIEHLNEKFY